MASPPAVFCQYAGIPTCASWRRTIYPDWNCSKAKGKNLSCRGKRAATMGRVHISLPPNSSYLLPLSDRLVLPSRLVLPLHVGLFLGWFKAPHTCGVFSKTIVQHTPVVLVQMPLKHAHAPDYSACMPCSERYAAEMTYKVSTIVFVCVHSVRNL